MTKVTFYARLVTIGEQNPYVRTDAHERNRDGSETNRDGAMDQRRVIKTSKFLALVLRHHPETVGIELDEAGWVDVSALLQALAKHGRSLTRAELDQVVAENDKKRFEIDPSGTRIRASQGHSVPVELGYPVATPPAVLYHGTVAGSLDSIFRSGLVPGERHHVHLSVDRATAIRVGSRRGRPVVLEVDAERMTADGHQFHVSTNGVWLTATVPPAYLRRLTEPAVG